MDADQRCSFSSPWTYHVFLSFRGKDTRHGFTHRLYDALVHAGIHTFLDDDEISKGQDISSELLKAIQFSKIFVVVFSTNYACSKWCLDELVNIIHCKKSSGQTVLPIFYDVDPSIVRHQKGTFAEAFARHEQRFGADFVRAQKWREALTEAANLSGWNLQNTADGLERKFIQKITEEISNKLNYRYLSDVIYPVGLDSRVQYLIDLLSIGTEGVCIVGICGMGGIGKTSIAKSFYNQQYLKFDGSSFLTSVREISKGPHGLIGLQEQLLFDILMNKRKNSKINSVDRGINMIRDRLHNRKVLVVLDDVDQLDQLNVLVRERDWFGSGSRIIITTRDVHLLNVVKVDKIYMAKELDHDESLELFSWHAFGKCDSETDYIELSKAISIYLGGVPLALQVLGSFLFDKRSIPEWESTLEKLKRIPNNEIQMQLRISFDALEDDELKDIFLDISCFFLGMDGEDVVRILDGCGFSSKIAIRVLMDRCLMTINKKNKLAMHDLLRDMGREIVRKESPKELGKRSRLWRHEDALDVLTKNTGTEVVEGLTLDFMGLNVVPLRTDAFIKMQKLRLLRLNYAHLTGSYQHFSQELRWLCWHGFPSNYLPVNFSLENVVEIDMSYSGLKQVWKETKVLKNLKLLNLTYCEKLTKTPSFEGLLSLETLYLEDCTSLVEVHPSIGNLDRLIFLNFQGCKSLRILPRNIFQLKSLQNLNLIGCLKLAKLPEGLSNMEELTELSIFSTAIKQLPDNINLLKNLKVLIFGQYYQPKSTFSFLYPKKPINSISLLPTSLSGLSSLRQLWLRNCELPDDALPKDIGSLQSLQELELSDNNFHCLPASISGLSKLEVLYMFNCTMLESIPDLPENLGYLEVSGCTSLERISSVSNVKVELMMHVSECNKLVEIGGLDDLENTAKIRIHSRSTKLQDSLKHSPRLEFV